MVSWSLGAVDFDGVGAGIQLGTILHQQMEKFGLVHFQRATIRREQDLLFVSSGVKIGPAESLYGLSVLC